MLFAAASALALAACASEDEAVPDKKSPPTYMLYSPNGEPLNGGPLGKPTCEEALAGWFKRLSGDENGRIDQSAFINDARIQFTRMDIDHNGYIVSEELDRFREPYRQQPPAQKAEPKEAEGKGHKSKRGQKSDNNNQADLSFTTSDPVMSADTNLDFKVTPDEFMKQAQDVFAKLDANHDGTLSRTEILAACEKRQ